MVNIFCAVLLGPGYGVMAAFVASLIRNLLEWEALWHFRKYVRCIDMRYCIQKTHNIIATMIGEVAGTSILGGLCAYPVAIFLMGKSAAGIAFYAYIIPFFISTAMGAVISGIIVFSIKKAGLLVKIQDNLAG